MSCKVTDIYSQFPGFDGGSKLRAAAYWCFHEYRIYLFNEKL